MELGQFAGIPTVGSTYKVTGNALQGIDIVAVAVRALVQVVLCALETTVKAAVAVMVNDDTLLADGALATLLDNSEFLRHRAIVVGTAAGTDGKVSYGGRTKGNRLVMPDPAIPVSCHMFNANLVLVPRFAYEKVGNLSPAYHHSFGDYDYGVRARKLGISCVVAPGILATCDRNPGPEKWRNAAYPLKERFAYLKSPKGRPLHEQFIFDTRLKGPFYAIGHGISVRFKMLFPKKK